METIVTSNVEFTFIPLTGFLVSEVWVGSTQGEEYRGEIIVSMN